MPTNAKPTVANPKATSLNQAGVPQFKFEDLENKDLFNNILKFSFVLMDFIVIICALLLIYNILQIGVAKKYNQLIQKFKQLEITEELKITGKHIPSI